MRYALHPLASTLAEAGRMTDQQQQPCNAAKSIDVWVDGITFSVTGASYFRLTLVVPKEKRRV